jgi:Rho-binding antiterminator
MSATTTDYKSIDCNFYDVLEAAATRHQQVYLQYFSDLRELRQGPATFKTFVIHEGAEYAVLGSGEEVRLDRIIRVDDTPAPAFSDYPDYRCGC